MSAGTRGLTLVHDFCSIRTTLKCFVQFVWLQCKHVLMEGSWTLRVLGWFSAQREETSLSKCREAPEGCCIHWWSRSWEFPHRMNSKTIDRRAFLSGNIVPLLWTCTELGSADQYREFSDPAAQKTKQDDKHCLVDNGNLGSIKLTLANAYKLSSLESSSYCGCCPIGRKFFFLSMLSSNLGQKTRVLERSRSKTKKARLRKQKRIWRS